MNLQAPRLQTELEADLCAINKDDQTKLLLENPLNMLESTTWVLARPDPTRFAVNCQMGLHQRLRSPPRKGRDRKCCKPNWIFRASGIQNDRPDLKQLRYEIARLKELEQKEAAVRTTAPTSDPAYPADAAANAPEGPASEPLELRQVQDQHQRREGTDGAAEPDLEFRRSEQQRILCDMAQYPEPIGKLPVRGQDMAQLTRDYEISEANCRCLLGMEHSAEMAAHMNRPLLYTLSSLAALVIGLAFGLSSEFKKDVLIGEWELPYIEISLNDESKPAGGKRQWHRKLRLAVMSSAVLSLLGIIVAGIYLVWQRG